MNPLTLPARPKALARPQERIPGATARQWFRVVDTDDPSTARIDIYDAIDSWGGAPGEDSFWGGISAEGFQRVLSGITTPRLALHVNSPGGDVWDGIAILNALIQHPAHVTAYVDGYAASIASVIVMGADEVEMGLGAQLMIHDASTVAWGNTADLQAAADLLDKVSDNIAGVYAARTGQPAAHWRELMRAETWFNADEAVSAGLASRMVTPEPAERPDDKQEARHWARDTWRFSDRDHAPSPTPLGGEYPPDPDALAAQIERAKPPHADSAPSAEPPEQLPAPVFDHAQLVRALREAVNA
jgi:ATP-dependent protease ClpP protease subunit